MLKEEWLAKANSIGYSNEREMFEDLYQTMPISEIARRLNFHSATITRRMGLLGITKRGRGGAHNSRNQKLKLWRSDQRIIFMFPVADVARALRVSQATLYNYRIANKAVKKETTCTSA
jgi:DNA invertase Pin-like site-specific DNA recombinase